MRGGSVPSTHAAVMVILLIVGSDGTEYIRSVMTPSMTLRRPRAPISTDLPGITVFILAVVTRLAFGKTGLTGKYTGSGKREWFATGKGFVYNVVLGGGIGIVVSFIAAFLYENEFTAAFSIFPIVCFGFAAITLIFTQTGFATPATHHIFLPSGLLPWPASPPGALRALCWACSSASWGSLLGDLVGKSLNSHCDTHIDPPATTIFILTIGDQRCQQRDQCLSQQRNP